VPVDPVKARPLETACPSTRSRSLDLSAWPSLTERARRRETDRRPFLLLPLRDCESGGAADSRREIRDTIFPERQEERPISRDTRGQNYPRAAADNGEEALTSQAQTRNDKRQDVSEIRRAGDRRPIFLASLLSPADSARVSLARV